ncbi:hypothetical protein Patl1_35319 [Pistacia atlantica]|nr:hypothetical protein Patl1_35319 [Pistacia atlantica]
MPQMMQILVKSDVAKVTTGYQFLHKGLLLQAVLHPSYTQHGGGSYQRLKFLGDAVLDYLITLHLFSTYPKLKPGQLTDLRSVLLNNKAFANVAVDRSLHNFLMFNSSGFSEAINNYVKFLKTSPSSRKLIEGTKCPKTLGDLVESCMGGILLDSGFNLSTVWKIMLSFFEPVMSFSGMQLNPITELQEAKGYSPNVVPDDYGFDSDICSDDVSDISSPSITPVNRWSSLAFKEVRRRPSETISDPSGDTDSQASGGSANGPARSHLYEICTTNCWKPPFFECCKDKRPSHLKS